MTTKTIDRKTYELAAHFLFDHPKINTESNRLKLASLIQSFTEVEVEFMRAQMEKAS